MKHNWLNILYTIIITIAIALPSCAATIPVIFDTDIGSDIDDTWALALLLSSPEVDLKMVLTDSQDTTARAKIAAKFLEEVRRTDVAVGIGVKTKSKVMPQAKWAEDYKLSNYPGKVYEDGIQAAIDIIKKSTTTVHLIVVGPCPNIPVMLQRDPTIVNKVKVFAMSGSVRRGYNDRPAPSPEYNVREDVPASQKLYSAPWDLTITPLDTCGIVTIIDKQYQGLVQTQNRLINALYENYKVWVEEGKHKVDPNSRSTTLFDTVAVYLSISNDFCKMEDLRLRVDQRGYTVIDKSSPEARLVSTATEWKDLPAYKEWIINRLLKGVVNMQ
jgi:inosine-uridine nucleoside N-ribohydrolase